MEKTVSIHDLKTLEDKGGDLTPQQRLALKNFERYRFQILSGIKEEEKFHLEFQRLQSMAKLSPYEKFLKEDFL